MQAKQSVTVAGLAAADGCALVALRPDLPAVAGTLRHPRSAIAQGGADATLAAVAGAATWLAACWLAAGLLAAAAARLPGLGGRVAAQFARVLLPRAVRVAVAGSAGLSLAMVPAAALAQGPPTPAPSAAANPSPTWPTDPATSPPPAARPSPTWPTDPATSPPPAWPTGPTAAPAGPAAPGRGQPAAHRVPAPESGSAGRSVTVRPGDSLWSIAARRLGPAASAPRVAAEWPRWFAANRAVIGDDPSLIHPGQVLQTPDPAPSDQEARR